MNWTRKTILFLCASALLASARAQQAAPVSAELGKETAWTGEAVPLTITLRSPGPFSGTASFDFPKLSRTMVTPMGGPVVGSEEIGDKTFFTQVHAFTLYTQMIGVVTIPSFGVRFEGKQTFTSDPEPMGGQTGELRFDSKRPPGSEDLGVLIATTEMEVTQTWSPSDPVEVKTGDVIQRDITRRATGTTAMMLSPVAAEAPDGIRVYAQDPIIQDRTERGEAKAQRTDTIKYQFETAGTFTIPELSFVWWDPENNELKRKSLPGATVIAHGSASTQADAEEQKIRPSPMLLALLSSAVVLIGWLCRKPVSRYWTAWNAKRNNPEALSAKRLIKACRANDAAAAYSALMGWRQSMHQGDRGADLDRDWQGAETQELRRESKTLSRLLFGAEREESTWTGDNLSKAFLKARQLRLTSRRPEDSGRHPHLPKLNPTLASRG